MLDNSTLNEIREAIRLDDISRLRSLIDEAPESLNMNTPFGTWLHVASKIGHLDQVQYLISKGSDVKINCLAYFKHN